MSVSKAILSENFKDLEEAIEGKTNEVYSTLLFDSYDDKRIEEVLFLEALNWIEELVSKMFYHSGAHLNYSDLISDPKKTIGERLTNDEYNIFSTIHSQQMQIIRNKCLESIKVDPVLPELLLYIKENHSKQIHEKHFQFGKISLEMRENNSTDFTLSYDEHHIFGHYSSSRPNCSFSFPYFTYYGYNLKWESTSQAYQSDFILTEENELKYGSCSYQFVPITLPIGKDFLLKRLCERHALNEHIVSSMKKKLEVERWYYHMKDLSIEDAKLTQEVNAKRE